MSQRAQDALLILALLGACAVAGISLGGRLGVHFTTEAERAAPRSLDLRPDPPPTPIHRER